MARMAGCADLVDSQQNRIGIAVDGDGADMLKMARRFPLMPQFISAAAVIPGVAAFNSTPERFFIHISYHQDFSAASFLNDGWNQSGAVKFYIFHRYTIHLYFCPSHGNPLFL